MESRNKSNQRQISKVLIEIAIILFFVFYLMLLYGCSSGSEKVFQTSSEIPIDTTNEVDLDSKKNFYFESMKSSNDSHGFVLPLDHSFQAHDQGDALLFNSISLVIQCKEKSLNLQQWEALKNLQKENGEIIRHPENTKEMSRDQLLGFLYLGAWAKKLNCSPIVDEFPTLLEKLVYYLKDRNWRVSGNTYFTNRHPFGAVYHIYDLSDGVLDLEKSVSSIAFNAGSADFFYSYKYKCEQTGHEFSCAIAGSFETFSIHLLFLQIVIFSIENEIANAPTFNQSELSEFWEGLAKVGDSIGFNNWLFVAGYRHFILDNPTFNDIYYFLKNNFPEELPTEKKGVDGWGCTDYLWQRTPKQFCNQDSTLKYTGIDFLHPLIFDGTR